MRYILCILVLGGCASYPVQSDHDVLKYNYHQKEWSYTPQDSQLKYNYLEKKWEWAK